jgi:hypothetical protein
VAQSRARGTQVADILERHAAATKMKYLIAGGVLAVLVAGWIGWILNDQFRSSHQVTVTDTFGGKVTVVSGTGDAGCVRPDKGGRPVCSNFAVLGGGSVHRGDEVRAAHEKVSTGGGNGYDMLVIYPATAP